MPSASALVYSDPNCPFCYALEERVHALGLQDTVEWRGVQHAPQLPVPMVAAAGPLALELPHEVASIRARAPEVAITTPPGKPNTALAITWAAAAQRVSPASARGFIRSLYPALWRDGLDLSDLGVLALLATAAGLPELEPLDDDRALAADWQRSWAGLGAGGVPLLVRLDGATLYGLADTAELARFLASEPVAP